ncbi:hypothetical protein [Gracilimonas sediminicola]|uniref:Uncharacterized protein n=1 Tax=Gracilimonas sediminicola TaxID=2952158 RepID=A0A9X2L413_9BACT|nr:hypothetical protein [Gracilimonas sediminicola]MCP9291862.1 hypothetical protein [Gracilimonas sediminicola]
MKISATYRFIASLLSLSILIGVSLPTGLHAKDLEECDAMETMHADHKMPMTMMAGHDDCPMEHQHKNEEANPAISMVGMHDYGFACACSIDEAPVKTEAPVFQKVKAKVLAVVQVIAEDHTTKTESDNHAILISDSYSPPPIFLANETFLI